MLISTRWNVESTVTYNKVSVQREHVMAALDPILTKHRVAQDQIQARLGGFTETDKDPVYYCQVLVGNSIEFQPLREILEPQLHGTHCCQSVRLGKTAMANGALKYVTEGNTEPIRMLVSPVL